MRKKRDSNRASLEIWFPEEDEVSVSLEFSSSQPKQDIPFSEIEIFSFYLTSQIANIAADPYVEVFADTLLGIDQDDPLASALATLGDLRFSAPAGRAKNGFTADYQPEEEPPLRLHTHGFDASTVGFFGLASTLALFVWLIDRREDDSRLELVLPAVARYVGFSARKGLPLKERSEIALAPEEVCLRAMHGAISGDLEDLIFEEVVASAASELSNLSAEAGLDPGGRYQVPDDFSQEFCLRWVYQELAQDDEAVWSTFEAMADAQDTEEAKAASTENAVQIRRAIREQGLESTAERLRDRLFHK